LGWVKGLPLATVIEQQPDTLRVIPMEPDWEPKESVVHDARPRHPRTDKILTPAEALRQEAINSFQCSEPSEMMIKTRMADIIKERNSIKVVSDNQDVVFDDLDIPGVSDPVPKDAPASALIKKKVLVNNLTDRMRWGY